MVLITIGLCVVFCLVLIGGVIWTVYHEEKDVKGNVVNKERIIGITDISEIIKECLNEEGAKVTTHSIDYCVFNYLGYEVYALTHKDSLDNEIFVEFKYNGENKYKISLTPGYESKEVLKSKVLKGVRGVLERIKTYKEDFNLFVDIKNNFKDLIVDEEGDKLFLEYNHIPITIRDFTRMFDSKEEVKVYHGNRLIKSNILSHGIYPYSINEEYFDSYNERVNSLDEVKSALEEIESKLLYDLSNFTDAFRSMMNVRINGFTLDINSLVVKEDYTMKFEYLNEFNTYYFEVKPFHKQYSYNKNDLDTRQGSFSEYRSLLHIIKDILEESKAMVPFDTEERPSMVFNNTTGQLEIDNKKYLSY